MSSLTLRLRNCPCLRSPLKAPSSTTTAPPLMVTVGHAVTAWPTVTIKGGAVVVEEGAFHGDLKHGKFLKRKVSDDIRSRPAL